MEAPENEAIYQPEKFKEGEYLVDNTHWQHVDCDLPTKFRHLKGKYDLKMYEKSCVQQR